MQGLVTKSAKLHYPGVAPGWNKVRESSPWFELIYEFRVLLCGTHDTVLWDNISMKRKIPATVALH